jgi:hypothetical protein
MADDDYRVPWGASGLRTAEDSSSRREPGQVRRPFPLSLVAGLVAAMGN